MEQKGINCLNQLHMGIRGIQNEFSQSHEPFGTTVIGQHGKVVGTISDVSVDVTSWQLSSLEIKLDREAVDALKLKHPWFGSQLITVPVAEISGASNIVVLEEMDFS